MTTTFAVLGAGSWGTAFALLLAQRADHRVRLWCARPGSFCSIRQDRENRRFLPGVPIPEVVEVTDDPGAALAGADLAVGAVPTVYLRRVVGWLKAAWPAGLPVVSLTKGIELETFLRPTEIWSRELSVSQAAVLSGPSHAEEVARGRPTSVVVAARDRGFARFVQACCTTERFRVYTNADVVGVELAGALKNVMGIAGGICDGLGFGDNAKAALMTRCLAEMTRFGVQFGAEPATFAGLAGVGDLITTCVSRHGRNRAVGERLGRGEKLADILAGSPMVAEGVTTTQVVYQKSTELGLDMPITAEVHAVLYEDKAPLDAVQDLMLRRPQTEEESLR
jgi:glycerol-3-phosphate dehydrogenase (NAD(P)+)